jgi:hypothetical protein
VVTEVEKTYQQMFQNKFGFFGARPDGKIDTLMEIPQEPIAVPLGTRLYDQGTGREVFNNPRPPPVQGRGRPGVAAPGSDAGVIPDSDVEPM